MGVKCNSSLLGLTSAFQNKLTKATFMCWLQ